eukprot:RCo055434
MYSSALRGPSAPDPQALLTELQALATENSDPAQAPLEGRVGPSKVSLHLPSVVGLVERCPECLHLLGAGNFSSARADAGVFSERWMYEVILGSGGVQQLGWTTINTRWTNEDGVGDNPRSYAYDGNRVKKWNLQKQNYGKEWEKGDVIGCCIDLNKGTITFYQNGECLGVAFEKIVTIHTIGRRSMDNSALAYFPAVSLSYNESCWLNLGHQPFLYPVPGYSAIHRLPPPVTTRAPHRRHLCACLLQLSMLAATRHQNQNQNQRSSCWGSSVAMAGHSSHGSGGGVGSEEGAGNGKAAGRGREVISGG